jgi:hypothetical protein
MGLYYSYKTRPAYNDAKRAEYVPSSDRFLLIQITFSVDEIKWTIKIIHQLKSLIASFENSRGMSTYIVVRPVQVEARRLADLCLGSLSECLKY